MQLWKNMSVGGLYTELFVLSFHTSKMLRNKVKCHYPSSVPSHPQIGRDWGWVVTLLLV